MRHQARTGVEEISFASSDGVELAGAYHPSHASPARGAIVRPHGITADMDERGMFVRLADRVAADGFESCASAFAATAAAAERRSA
jgi:hypothetical protein